MPVMKPYHRFGKMYLVANVLFTLPAAVLLLLIYVLRESFLELVTLGSVFLVYCLIGLYFQHRRGKYMTCPECGRRLERKPLPELNVNDPINFVCEDCDIEWETSLSVSDS